MKLSLSEQLILGILSEQARHGYDIEKVITDRGMRKWTDVGFSSIYYVLERLEAKGLATSSDTQGKQKKQYSITDTGVSALKGEAKKLIAERKPANTHFMTGLATSQLIEDTELNKTLEQRKATLASDLKVLEGKASSVERMPRSARQLFNLSEVLLKAELNWVNKELKRKD
ncbi:helix-turn-helix transcriptional regulator [Candidatus Nomurabacteria bacterium]|nr:helix-turn-helix transcriptional regulator [Candidatus Nomurabacteria bacterium]